jgi:type IV secretion system protein VirB6
MNGTFYQSSVSTFENLLNPAGNTAMASGLAAMAGPLTTLLVIYVITTGILCSLGEFSARIAVGRILRAGFVSMLLTVTYFNPYVRDLFITTLPAWFASSLSNSSSTLSVPQQCDLIRSAMLHMGAAIYQNTTWQDLDVRMQTQIITTLGTGFLAVLVLVYELTRTFMVLTVCAAPFVIAGYLFDATKSFVEGWIGKAVGLTLLQLLVSITAQIVVDADSNMVRTTANNIGAGALEQVSNLVAVVVFFLMMAVVLIGLPGIAYSIGRGVVINTGAPAAIALPGRMMRAFSNSSLNLRIRR